MANSLIGCAPHREKAPLEPLDGAEPGSVAVIQWAHTDAEVDGIVTAIAQDIAAEKLEPGQILVLTNWAELGRRIRERLTRLAVPARSYFREQSLRSDESREALALLRLVCCGQDLPALRVLVGLGDGDGRSEAYRRVTVFADSQGLDVFTVLEQLAAGEHREVNARALAEHFSTAMDRVSRLSQMDPPSLVDALLPEDAEPLSELRATAVDSLTQADSAVDVLSAIVESVTQDDVPQSPDFVRIMSLHKSKGLTCDTVYVVGTVDGVVPTIRARDAAAHELALCEGRRLFFVSLTRATRELTVSSSISTNLADAAARGVRFDKKTIRVINGTHTVKMIASPFMIELGSESPRAQTGETWLQTRLD